MLYYITKTGLDVFDTARAWGLAVVLNVLTLDEVVLTDSEWTFVLDPVLPVPSGASLNSQLQWGTLFNDENWQRVFMTAKKKWTTKRDKARNVLQNNLAQILSNICQPANVVSFGTGETLPGGLDPTSFKGLRHDTRARYAEDQLKVEENHWALACLGMATCGTYHQESKQQSNWLVLLPVPQQIRFWYFQDVRDLLRPSGVRYHSVQNAAAHYAVQLAERLRSRAAAVESLRDRFSAVLYFRLFGAGQQIKPAQGHQIRLEPLLDAINRDPHGSHKMLRWLDYCFRLGSEKGNEDLAFAATELVMRWDLDAYDRLIRTFVRFQKRGKVKGENYPTIETIKEVIHNVTV